MKKPSYRSAPICPVIETLENRTLLSGVVATGDIAAAPDRGALFVAAKPVKKAATKTTLAASAGTLDQPITFTVTVRASAAAGSPVGTANVIDHGHVIQSVTLSPAASTNAKYAVSDATYTLTQQPGGAPYYFGKHPVSAAFIPGGTFKKSTGRTTFTVSAPSYTSLPDGVEYQTVLPGAGPTIQTGQTANVFYTGFLAKNGRIFDDSVNDGGSLFPFMLGAGDVIPGFDEGTVGMSVGETRLILIPPAQGYGATPNGPIPANSTLLFVITLESIS
ncbi:MAG TPA: FKBP-type peptidyl-prolyl cis-trans isomerase [Tepidisphaeraceae bacterium]|jgi:hypothetical protein|nr:FKBP-type peptidyl-prolyl cis-trans isomerase [Tepidisphaeraceae bacterium]